MKKLLSISLLLFALVVYSACGSDDEDFGTSYWRASELYGKWVDDNNPDEFYIEFSSPNIVKKRSYNGFKQGIFKASYDEDGKGIHIQFNDTDRKDLYSWYSFEWLSTDKKKMKLDGTNYTRQ